VTWDLEPVAHAIADLLGAIDATVKAYPAAPETFNPPAYVVGFPVSVVRGAGAMGVDVAQLPVAACAGPTESFKPNALLIAAIPALEADPTFGGVVIGSKVTNAQQSYRRLSVAGIEVLAADLLLEIRM